VDDNPDTVINNRKIFFSELGLHKVVTQKQVHGDRIEIITNAETVSESDAMITDRPGLGLAISTADCNSIFIYEPKNKIIAAVHSGWRGTQKRILNKVLVILKEEFKLSAGNLICYLGPSISQKNYEVGKEVANLFDKKYLKSDSGKIFLDVTRVNYDILINSGVKKENVQVSNLCSFENKNLLHSYRRDGLKSGRALGVIAIKN
jgi:YfiH family protein